MNKQLRLKDLEPYVRNPWSIGTNLLFESPSLVVTDDEDPGVVKLMPQDAPIDEKYVREKLDLLSQQSRRHYWHSARSPQVFKNINTTTVIYQHILTLLTRRKTLRKLRLYLLTHLLVVDWFRDSMEKSYAPGGPGYARTMSETLVGK